MRRPISCFIGPLSGIDDPDLVLLFVADLVVGAAEAVLLNVKYDYFKGGFLASESFQRRLAALQTEFLALPARPALHAGGAYPADPGQLVRTIEGHFTHPEDPEELRPA
jgi:hypothetical protein